MIKFARTIALCFFVAPTLGFAKEPDATDLVACMNSANDHSNLTEDSPWALTQARLNLPFAPHQLEKGETPYFIAGKPLGWHITWVAFLNPVAGEWTAFETMTEGATHMPFGATFVPKEVVSAFVECGVTWGGFWTAEYPFVNSASEKSFAVKPFPNPPLDLNDLLPPKLEED